MRLDNVLTRNMMEFYSAKIQLWICSNYYCCVVYGCTDACSTCVKHCPFHGIPLFLLSLCILYSLTYSIDEYCISFVRPIFVCDINWWIKLRVLFYDVRATASMRQSRATKIVMVATQLITAVLRRPLPRSPVRTSATTPRRAPRSARRRSSRPSDSLRPPTASRAWCRRWSTTWARPSTSVRLAGVSGWSSTSRGSGSRRSDALWTGSRPPCLATRPNDVATGTRGAANFSSTDIGLPSKYDRQ